MRHITLLGMGILLLLAACRAQPTTMPTAIPIPTDTPPPAPTATEPAPTSAATEAAVTVIPLTNPAAKSSAEFSGMAWYGDYLILLPQYPTFSTTHGDGLVFAIPKSDILAFLDGTIEPPLDPIPIPVVAPDVRWGAPGFEGYESIAFDGDVAFLTIEANPEGPGMMGYLVRGTMAADLSALTLNADSMQQIPPQAKISNFSDETLFITPTGVGTLYEANGENVNPSPVAHQFDKNGTPTDAIPFPNIEYRITDATALDEDLNFWAINYLYPGDLKKVNPAIDALTMRFGEGKTHSESNGVERLVKFHFSEDGISLTDDPPVQLQLLSDDLRNWEGIARLDNHGFLLATDKFPETILAFVPFANP